MPLYAGIGGAQKEIGEIYAGIGGYAKKLEQLYAGVGGAAKELLASGYTWKKYNISDAPGLEYVGTANSTYTTYSSGYTLMMYTDNASNITWSNNDPSSGLAFFGKNKCKFTQAASFYNEYADYVGFYIPINDDYTMKTYNSTSYGATNVSASYVLKITGRYSADSKFGVKGEVYKPVLQLGEYIGTVSASDISSYPMNGVQDGYYYVYDGEVTWAKYSLNQISEPSTFGSSSSFSNPSTSSPYLMASQAKKDSNGNVDWGTTYTATSSTTLRNNYTNYPYCSMASTLDADNLYKITSASTLSRQRQQVTGWAVTSESAGDYIGDVTGKYGDYPENGKQDGYWYILQEIT